MGTLGPALLSTLVRAVLVATAVGMGRGGGRVIESLRALAHDAASDKPLQRPQLAVIFRRHKTDGIAHRVRPACPSDAMDVILRVHREIVVHHVRDAVHVNAARRDVRRHEHAHRTGLEILQRLEALVLRAVGGGCINL